MLVYPLNISQFPPKIICCCISKLVSLKVVSETSLEDMLSQVGLQHADHRGTLQEEIIVRISCRLEP